jgi:hypothetical protein
MTYQANISACGMHAIYNNLITVFLSILAIEKERFAPTREPVSREIVLEKFLNPDNKENFDCAAEDPVLA